MWCFLIHFFLYSCAPSEANRDWKQTVIDFISIKCSRIKLVMLTLL